MDPITIIGTAGAVANIVDVIGKTISTLRDLHGRWKEADMTILNLITQLNALKAALNKIAEWISSDLEDIPQHHQLVIDLKDSIHCCKTLIMSVDNQISKLNWKEENTLDVGSRIRVVFETKTSQDFQKFIKRQTSALKLLLVACNCKTLSQQKVVLEKPKSRQVFDQVKEDASSSLFVLYDTASITSCWTASTDNSSKLSRVFSFGRELMSTRVYPGSFRSLYKRTLRRGKGTDLDSTKSQSTTRSMISERKKQEARSRDIDKMLEEDSRKMRQCKVLVMGAADSGKETIMKQMKIVHQNEFTIEECQAYRDQIRNKTIEDMHTCIKTMMDLESKDPQDVEVNKHAHIILKHSPLVKEIPQELADAIESLWRVKKDYFLERRFEISAKLVSFFYDEIQRIARSDYKPTETDILLLPEETTGVREARFNIGQLSIHAFDIDGLQGERKKWIYQFENVTSIIFVVDLASYDQMLLEESHQNKMFESLVLFDSIVNSQWFMRTSIVLFLSNVSQFKVKLAKNPLGNFFPDYSGGNDVNRAAKYILWRFNQVNRARLNLYPHLAEATDLSNIRFISMAVKETVLQNSLKGFRAV